MPVPETAPSGGFLEVLDTNPGIPLGQIVEDAQQREWCFVKAGVAIEQGEALMFNAAVVSITNISEVAAIGSTIIEEALATFITSGVLVDMLISISDGTGEGQLGWVREVISETKIRVEWLTSSNGKLDTATDVNSDAVIFAPWLMTLATVSKAVNGFAQKDAAVNKFFWMLSTGIGLGRCDTSVSIAANDPLAVGDTAGQLTRAYPALTTQLTSLTHSAPGTPDYAIANLTQTNPFGFVADDEGRTVLSVIINLQTRLAELDDIVGRVVCAIAVHDNDADDKLFPIIADAIAPRGIPKKDRYGYAPALT